MANVVRLLSLTMGLAMVACPTIAQARDEFPVGSTAVVSGTDGSGLRVRSGPGMSYRIVGTLSEGTAVEIKAGPASDDDDDWYQLSVNGKVLGWSLEKYLKPRAPAESRSDGDGRRAFDAKVTAYADGVGGVPLNARTATGTRTRWGVVAVDPRFIPLGSTMRIEGYGDQVFLAEDVGGAIRGATIDIWLPDGSEARRYGTQRRRVTILREGPAR
jgi:3D (Asp-Asp-Asp) domain-containing protein